MLNTDALTRLALGHAAAKYLDDNGKSSVSVLREWQQAPSTRCIVEPETTRNVDSEKMLIKFSGKVNELLDAFEAVTAWSELEWKEYSGKTCTRNKELIDRAIVGIWSIVKGRTSMASPPDRTFKLDWRRNQLVVGEQLSKLDRVFLPDVSMSVMFDELKPWIDITLSCSTPRNVAVLAFGYSGLGKTRVMTGDGLTNKDNRVGFVRQKESLTRLSIEHVLKAAKNMDACVTARCIDIYMQKVYDGTQPQNTRNALSGDLAHGVTSWRFRKCLNEVDIVDAENLGKFIDGCVKNRPSQKTPRNDSESSRSHQLMLFDIVEKGGKIHSSVLFGDLAGEEGKETVGPESAQRRSILSELGNVIDHVFPMLQGMSTSSKDKGWKKAHRKCRRAQGHLAPILGRFFNEREFRVVMIAALGAESPAKENEWTLTSVLRTRKQ